MHEIEVSKQSSKSQRLRSLLPQIEALISGETDQIAKLANVTAALKQACGYFWVGFYLVKEEELVLGPFQGPVACTRIGYGKGVCGTAWEKGQVMVVPDVEKFPGHIACNSASKSEVVLPVMQNGTISMVLDVDSDQLDDFSQEEVALLKQLVGLLGDS